jgi:hypothetical protein
LILKPVASISVEAVKNLKLLISYLENYFNKPVGIEYTEKAYNLKDYATSHPYNIMYVTHKKLELLRKLGLSKSSVI